MSEKSSVMQVMFVNRDQLPIIKDYLLPEIYKQAEDGMPVTVLALAADDMAVGALAGAIMGKAFRIYSIFVANDYRHQGGGRLLIDSVKKTVSEKKLGVEVAFTGVTGEERGLEVFLKKIGFSEKKGEKAGYYAVRLEDVVNSNLYNERPEDIGIPFSKISNGSLLRATNNSLRKFYPMPENGLLSEKIDRDSSIGLVKRGEIYAYITIEDIDESNIFCSAWFPGKETPIVMLKLLKQELKILKDNYRGETRIVIEVLNEQVYKLCSRLFNNPEYLSRVYVSKDM